MSSYALAACVAVLWTICAAPAAASAVGHSDSLASAAVEGPSLSEMARLVEPIGRLLLADWTEPTASAPVDEGRGKSKKGKPMKMAMMMAGTAAGSMMMMKAMGAIKLFIIHSFFATKLGLIVAAYLLLCKLAEMKKPMAKKEQPIKWASPPSSHDFEEHSSAMASYPEPQHPMMSSYEQHAPQPEQQQQQQPADQYGPPPSQHQQFMPSGDFGGGGGGGDMQGHYSHVSPVTYRPPINRNHQDAMKSSGRIQ